MPQFTSNSRNSVGVDDDDVEMTTGTEAETIQVDDLMDMQAEDTSGMDFARLWYTATRVCRNNLM
jgi:hypothetical protein